MYYKEDYRASGFVCRGFEVSMGARRDFPFLGFLIMRSIVFGSLYQGPTFFGGNYHVGVRRDMQRKFGGSFRVETFHKPGHVSLSTYNSGVTGYHSLAATPLIWGLNSRLHIEEIYWMCEDLSMV